MLVKELGKQRISKIKSPKNLTTYTVNINLNNNIQKQRVSLKRRGRKRYFVFLQERNFDFYCLIQFSIGMPLMKDNFLTEECIFVDSQLKNVKEFLIDLSKKNNKSITFSLNSIKIKND